MFSLHNLVHQSILKRYGTSEELRWLEFFEANVSNENENWCPICGTRSIQWYANRILDGLSFTFSCSKCHSKQIAQCTKISWATFLYNDPVWLYSPGMIICYKLAWVLLLGTTFLSLVQCSCPTSPYSWVGSWLQSSIVVVPIFGIINCNTGVASKIMSLLKNVYFSLHENHVIIYLKQSLNVIWGYCLNQGPRREGQTETALMLCKLNKSL